MTLRSSNGILQTNSRHGEQSKRGIVARAWNLWLKNGLGRYFCMIDMARCLTQRVMIAICAWKIAMDQHRQICMQFNVHDTRSS